MKTRFLSFILALVLLAGLMSTALATGTDSRILPYASNDRINVVKGTEMKLPFVLDSTGKTGQSYFIGIYDSSDTLVQSKTGTFGAAGLSAVTLSWATGRFAVGTYTVKCHTVENGKAVADTARTFTVYVSKSAVRLNEIHFAAQADPDTPVTSIAVELGGESADYAVIFSPENTTAKRGLTLTVADPTVAEIARQGDRLVLRGKTAGTTTLTAVTEQGYTCSCTVTVRKFAESIDIVQSTLDLTVGEAETLRAVYTPADAADHGTIWTSSDPEIVHVSSSGKLTALRSGTAVITATVDNKSDTCTVRVTGTALPFTDVEAGIWYYGAVRYVYEKSLFSGISATAFGPDVETTRAMLVTVLWRMENKPAAQAACPFDDVPTGSYYHDAVVWASENGIVNGISDTEFAPDRTLTREQTATLLYRYIDYKGGSTAGSADLSAFPDGDSVSTYAVSAMEWACHTGLITGTTGADGKPRLDPQGGTTRAQMATIIMRAGL